MKPLTHEKRKEIAANWRQMKEVFAKQQRLIAELAAHPDVTDEMLVQRTRELGRAYNHLKEVSRSLHDISMKYHTYIETSF